MPCFKRTLAVAAAAAILISTVGCSQPTSSGQSVPGGGEGQRTEVLLWHSMGGANQEKLMNIVNGFNQSQDKVVVVAENQGNYDESTSKFFSMNLGPDSPAMIQIGEQNLQSMIDSGLVASVSDLIAKSGYDRAQLLPQAIQFYTVQNTMYAMPFNTSSPILYYNVEALRELGYDTAPATFEEILEVGEKLKAAGSTMRAFSKPVYGYAFDQMITNMGGLVVDNENGRSARATQVAYQREAGEILSWLQQLVASDQFVNYGKSHDNTIAGFFKGDVSMMITTSALAASVIDGADFEVGVGPLPLPQGVERQGVYAGGGAICVAKDLPEEVQAGVMDFLAYATSAEVQAVWAGGTGYFPVNVNSYDTATMKAIYQKTPQLEVAAQQLRSSKQTAATAGPLLSLLPQLRNDLQAAEELVFSGGDASQALEQAAANTNQQITTANKSVQ